jgi:hypothetical protein
LLRTRTAFTIPAFARANGGARPHDWGLTTMQSRTSSEHVLLLAVLVIIALAIAQCFRAMS